MKKLFLFLVAVFMMIGPATSAFAGPGNPGMPRYDDRSRYERPDYRHDQRVRYDHRDFRSHWTPYSRPVIVDRRVIVPVRQPVRVYEYYTPGFSLYLPGFSIQIR
jgi:hypothetical protein